MRTGIVKFFNHKNKFGFIIDLETRQEYYVHIKDVNGIIKDGDQVTFELKEARRGMSCMNVKKI